MISFIDSKPIIALEYAQYINKLIYKNSYRTNRNYNAFWTTAWEDFYKEVTEINNFGLFLNTQTGKKWLETDFGKMYITWQTG